MLGSVHRVLWATLLCWNKKSTWIHTGTGNKNTTTFTKYVFSCSYSYLMDSFFSFSYFSDKFKWLSALKSWTHSPTRIKDSSASFLRYIRISPSTLSHTGSSFFRSLFLSHHCYLGALHLFIICAVESRLASAVLATHLVPLQLSFKPTSYTIFTISKKLFSPHPPFADLVSQISDRLDITFVWFTHGFLSVFLFVTMRQNVYSSDSLPIVSYSCTNLEQQTNTCIRGVWLLPLLLCIIM